MRTPTNPAMVANTITLVGSGTGATPTVNPLHVSATGFVQLIVESVPVLEV